MVRGHFGGRFHPRRRRTQAQPPRRCRLGHGFPRRGDRHHRRMGRCAADGLVLEFGVRSDPGRRPDHFGLCAGLRPVAQFAAAGRHHLFALWRRRLYYPVQPVGDAAVLVDVGRPAVHHGLSVRPGHHDHAARASDRRLPGASGPSDRGAGGCTRQGGRRQRRQVELPGRHLARASHADERRPRGGPAAQCDAT